MRLFNTSERAPSALLIILTLFAAGVGFSQGTAFPASTEITLGYVPLDELDRKDRRPLACASERRQGTNE